MNAIEYYMALDLELNNAPDGSTPNPKIIQVGVSIGTFDHFIDNSFITKSWLIDPEENIYPFITGLTGITDADIKTSSVSHACCARELRDLIEEYKPFVNPVTWGQGDIVELQAEFSERMIKFPYFGRRIIDVKTWYVLHMLAKSKKPSGGLKSAMAEFGVKFVGTPHRADVDAENTLRLFFTILDRQDRLYSLINQAKAV